MSAAASLGRGGSVPVLDMIAGFVSGCDLHGRFGVAVSGGSDSTGLLLALHEIAGPDRLVAFTVNHRLRDGSAREARAVAELCDGLGIEHEVLIWTGEKPRAGIQAAARAARQALLRDAARRRGIDMVALAHTADDQDETRAMRARRSDDELAPGQAGIPPATLIGGDVWFLRPLLSTRRQAIRDYLARHGVGWIDDPSNSDPRFERVRIRLGGLPAVGEQGGEVSRLRVARAKLLAEDLDERASVTGGETFEFEMGGLAPSRAAACVEALIGLAGGRERAMDRHGRERLTSYVEGRGPDRLTLGRSELIRHGTKIVVRRERRNIGTAAIAPGETVLWDGRFFIRNLDGREMLQVRGGGAAGISPEIVRERQETVDVYASSDGTRGGFSIVPACGRASRILPVYELAVANALARLCARAPFPACPWRDWQKVVRA